MTWFGYVFVALVAVGGFLSVVSVGKPREPMAPVTAALIVVTDALLIWGAVAVGTTP